MTAPTFSVVIPTRDRNELLAQCLARLAPGAQLGVDAADYEVIVADDSPTEAARAYLSTHFPWARWVAGPRRGPASNRNRGAAAASAQLLVFIDDDCLPEPGFLLGYATALRGEISVYEGQITCAAGVHSPRETSPINLSGGVLWSCNFAIRRDTFAAIGGFDERFPFAHMEDEDLRERIVTAGYDITFVADASVDHPPRRLRWGAQLARIHQASMLFMTLHPPMRSLAWYLQNQFRARVSRIVRLPKSLDSLWALASVPVELATIALRWRAWQQWARTTAETPR